MRYFILFMLLCSTSYGQTIQNVTVVDNSTYTYQTTDSVDVTDVQRQIDLLNRQNSMLQARIDDNTGKIAQLQAEIDAGAQAGVANAVQYASPALQQSLNNKGVTP